MKTTRTIRSHVFLLLLAAAVPLLVMLAYAIYSGAESRVSIEKAAARTLAVITATDIDRVIRMNRKAMERIALRPNIQSAALGQCDDFLDDFHEVFPAFANATVIDPDGIAVCSAVPQPGGKPVFVGKAEWFVRAKAEQRFVVGRPFLGPITGRWVSVLISPVRDSMGALTGYLGFPLDLAAYRPSISNANLKEGTTVGVIDDKGTMIWRNIDPEAWVGKDVASNRAAEQALSGRREYSGRGIDGVERVYFVETLTEADWLVYVGIPKQTLFSDAIYNVVRNTGLGVVFLSIVLALAARLTQRIADPIRDLARVAREIKDGKVDLRATPSGPRELVEVAQEFNEMVDVREAQNRRLLEREEALRQSNAELERFAYVASHDLQTPLRTVVSYTQLLERRYRGGLDAEADEFITFIVTAAKQMVSLINDLLDYARVSNQGEPVTPVNLEQTVCEALANLKSDLDSTGAEVVVEPLPSALGDHYQLSSLLQNLLENALKYRHPQRPPQITVSVHSHSPTHWRFAVKDNGIGIEQQYYAKIFEIFQRLTPTDNPDGTGIGLALCRRILHRLGGEIWVESSPGEGSTFYFTLKKVPEGQEG